MPLDEMDREPIVASATAPASAAFHMNNPIVVGDGVDVTNEGARRKLKIRFKPAGMRLKLGLRIY